jgi:threonine dehydrogenase-like Zn-dependent dehydrogenase
VSKSDVVMILGCGMIGAGAIISAVQKGARVIAADIDDYKLNLAAELGASHTIHSISSDLHDELMKLTQGKGPDVVVEAAGNPATYRMAVEEVAFTGRVVCIGYAGIEVAFATKLFVQKEMDILGSRNATADDFKNVMAYLEQGTFPMNRMLSRVVSVEEAGEALRSWADNPGRVMKILVEF